MNTKTIGTGLASVGCVVVLLLGASCSSSGDRVVHPVARSYSQPLQVNQVQSAAFWEHPTDSTKSLLLVANENRGLEVHDLDGVLMKHVGDGDEPAYVDVLYDFPLAGKATDLVLVSSLNSASAGIKFWQIDPARRKVIPLPTDSVVKVFDGATPIGLCSYRSAKTGRHYFIATLRAGAAEQYEITSSATGEIVAKRVKQFKFETEIKSCIADDEAGSIYFAEDDIGIWRYPAEPDDMTAGKLVVKANEHGLIPNIKGPAIYGASGGRGYLLVVSQGSRPGNAAVNVYERGGDNAFVLRIEPSAVGWGGIEHSSGLAVFNQPGGSHFPAGILAINDQVNANASEDFKLYSWKDIAQAGNLIIDTTWSRRPRK